MAGRASATRSGVADDFFEGRTPTVIHSGFDRVLVHFKAMAKSAAGVCDHRFYHSSWLNVTETQSQCDPV